MSAPFSVHIVDAALADKARDQITLGGRFVFIDDAALLDSGRRGRLQSWRTHARKVVKAVVDGPLTVSGLRLTSTARPNGNLRFSVTRRTNCPRRYQNE